MSWGGEQAGAGGFLRTADLVSLSVLISFSFLNKEHVEHRERLNSARQEGSQNLNSDLPNSHAAYHLHKLYSKSELEEDRELMSALQLPCISTVGNTG